ncbi:Hsp70 family protein, partial [Paractinoplanes ferrugineus]
MVEYGLGVDLGTTYTAAAINVGGDVETVRLGGREPEIPSVVFLRPDGEVLVGDAARRRGESEPTRLAREFKRRLGDPVPILLGGTPMSAHALTARLLKHVTAAVAATQGGPPSRIVLTHPANWGPYKRELLTQAAQLADLPPTTLRTEPEAAAVRYASTARVAPGETIAVYDLGGGTFDAAVLRKTTDGFEVLGEPQGVEQLGGIDFDEAILEYVRGRLSDRLAGMDLADPSVTEALTRLRRECVAAKENLSFDPDTEIGVALPRLHTRIRLHRSEFEALIAPALEDTVAAVHRALRAASVTPADLRCILLAGGSSRIPLVGAVVAESFGRPVASDEQPELGIALGAARLSGPAGRLREPAASPLTPTATPPPLAARHPPHQPAAGTPGVGLGVAGPAALGPAALGPAALGPAGLGPAGVGPAGVGSGAGGSGAVGSGALGLGAAGGGPARADGAGPGPADGLSASGSAAHGGASARFSGAARVPGAGSGDPGGAFPQQRAGTPEEGFAAGRVVVGPAPVSGA